MSENHYDLVVLGGGPGGYTAAFRAADLGLSVCLVEQHQRLGGVCLKVGCIPSKTLLHAADLIDQGALAKDYGILYQRPEIDINRLREKKEEIVSQLTTGLDGLAKARGVVRLTGRGRLTDAKTITVQTGEQELQLGAANIILATGSSPIELPGLAEDDRIWDSTKALALSTIPRRLLVIGGGIIGLEMAQIYAALGSTITIVEMEDQLLAAADKDLIAPLVQKLKKKYRILTKTRVKELRSLADEIQVALEGKEEAVEGFDAVLVAVGRRPNSDVGLAEQGLAIDDRGFVEVDERCQTSIPGIYAIGDLVAGPMLAHKATHQGKTAAEVIAGHAAAFTPMAIPSVAYTSPELAWIGMTEKEAKEKKIAYIKGKFPWGASGRALSSGVAEGVSKAIFAKDTGRLLGAGICGYSAGELIHEAVLALEMGATAEDISLTVHAHPTLAETFAFAAEIAHGSATDVLPPRKR